MKHHISVGIASVAATFLLSVAAQPQSRNASDSQPSTSMSDVTITSGGSRMNGLVYLAAPLGQHPVVVFLHGYPGNGKNLDLEQAVRRAGYQALYVDYRGMWGSGGTFSFAHALEDTKAVLTW